MDSTRITTDPTDPRLGHGVNEIPVSQNEAYLVLSEEERAKGFVRPLRKTYVHTGKRPKYPTRELTEEENKRYGSDGGYVAYEEYPENERPIIGRVWTKADLETGCGAETTMGLALAETYARQPDFYGATYCCGCNMHRSVEEFKWKDGSILGS